MIAIPAVVAGALAAAYIDAKYWIAQDITKLYKGIKAFKGYQAAAQKYEKNCSVYEVIHRTIGAHDEKVAFIFEDRQWTFKDLRIEIERLEQDFVRRGIRNRDYIGLFMNNSPEFFFTFFALIKIGAIPVFINTSLAKDRLLHCVDLPRPAFVITTYELHATLETATVGTVYAKRIICYDHDTYPFEVIRSPLILHWHLPPARTDGTQWTSPPVHRNDPGLLLFTSGTTGLPKASIIPAFFMMACTFPNPLLNPKDKVYCPLPWFHGTAILIGTLIVLGSSSTVVMSRKFSNRTFWPEIRASKATVVIYIGEMIRYICQAPTSSLDSQNEVRLFWGLGLQSRENWLRLRHRFGVDAIYEYYGSTEGTATASNLNLNDAYGVGKCGHRGPLLRALDNRFVLVKHDLSTGELYRNSEGLCVPVGPNEPGEALTLTDEITTPHDYLNNSAASTAKIARNVLKQGDAYVRMGDLLEYDGDGFIAFKDRLGDTYRVKGHNISTTEVEECLNRHPGITSSSCYSVNGQGMAAVMLKPGSKDVVKSLESALIDMGLPKYAVPKYLRIVSDLDTTATHKIAKSSLKKEGLTGECFIIQREGQGYIPMLTSKL